jgi:peroxin-7
MPGICVVQVWDVRKPDMPIVVLQSHSYPVRKLAFSPHVESLLLSCSYDMTVRLFDIAAQEDPLLEVWSHHTEFAVGLDWDVLTDGMVASCGWDACMYTWHRTGHPQR